jgi:hypothetical protein
MARSYPGFTINTNTWVNLISIVSINGKAATIQNRSTESVVQIFFGGPTMPVNTFDGLKIQPGESVVGTNDYIWAYAEGHPGDKVYLAVMEND